MNNQPAAVSIQRALFITVKGSTIAITEEDGWLLRAELDVALGVLPAAPVPVAIPPIPDELRPFEEIHAEESVVPLADEVPKLPPVSDWPETITPREEVPLDWVAAGTVDIPPAIDRATEPAISSAKTDEGPGSTEPVKTSDISALEPWEEKLLEVYANQLARQTGQFPGVCPECLEDQLATCCGFDLGHSRPPRVMRAISLWQPWAELVVIGAKRFETRHWSTNVRGVVAIHAAKRWTADEREYADDFATLLGVPVCDPPVLGAIVGTVELVNCCETELLVRDSLLSPNEEAFGNFASGRYAWDLANPVKFIEPIPYRGCQGFFEVDL